MIGVLTHHWAKPDKVAEAKALLERNGAAQSRFGGFGTRQTLYGLNDATKITTLVTWVSSEVYDAWRASPERVVAMAGADELWAKPPESERFEVAG
jgi:heme-degrading monooxygenase HmoA